MNAEQNLFDLIVNRVGFLMERDDPYEEIRKMIVMELTLNPELAELSDHSQIFYQVVEKLVAFYDDKVLTSLWNEYKYYDLIGNAA